MLKFHTKSDEELDNMSPEDRKTYEASLTPYGWVEYVGWLEDPGIFTVDYDDCAEDVAERFNLPYERAMAVVIKVLEAHGWKYE